MGVDCQSISVLSSVQESESNREVCRELGTDDYREEIQDGI